MNKFLTGILVLFLLIVGVEIVTLVSLPRINHPAIFSSNYSSPITNSLPKGFSIINQKKNDSIGRTIVFSATTENNAHQGIGIILILPDSVVKLERLPWRLLQVNSATNSRGTCSR